MVKHIIEGITTLCGRTLNDENWPVDHNWAQPDKPETSTCAKCRDLAGLKVTPAHFLDQIDDIYVFVGIDNGGEGILGLPIGPGGAMMPLIASDITRLKDIVPLAKELADAGMNIRLVKFTKRIVIDEFRSEMETTVVVTDQLQ